MRKATLANEARKALAYDQGLVGVSSKNGAVIGLPFLVVGAYRMKDPFHTAREQIDRSGLPNTCVVLGPRDAKTRDDLGVYVPMALWAAMVAAYVRETERRDDGTPAHRR